MSDDAHDEPHPQVADGRGKTQLETQNAYHVKYTPRIYLYLDLLIDNKHDASNAEGTNGANGKHRQRTGAAMTAAELATAVPPLLPIDIDNE